MVKILVCLDEHDIKRSADLAGGVENLYLRTEVKLHAVAFGEISEEVTGYFDVIHQFAVSKGQTYNVRWISEHIRMLQEREQYSCIIIPSTPIWRMIAPSLAIKLETGLVADVVEVRKEEEKLCMVRPAFEGKLMACILNKEENIVIMTVRLGIFHFRGETDRETKTITIMHKLETEENLPIKVLSENISRKESDIRDAKVLVAGGGGVGKQFPKLQKLVEPLHAMIASSRNLVDAGIAPRSIQVGQSGKIVSPKLYIALGIYGSLQHIEGLDNVDNIIAVNTNKNAPICSLASIVVEGDAIEFVEKLSEKIRKNQKKEI